MATTIKINFGEAITEKHNYLTCIYCNRSLAPSSFYESSSRNAMCRGDIKNKTHSIACKSCTQELFEYLLKIYRNNKAKALRHLCSSLDIYYNEELIQKIDNVDTTLIVDEYYKLLYADVKTARKTFIDSVITEMDHIVDESLIGLEDELNEEDLKNKREILNVFHYDPFEREPVKERKKLYRDLVTMCDVAMADDLVRQRAAIEIVRSFARIDAWTETINEISKDPHAMIQKSKELKALIDAKNKETDMVTKFSKDHGFAERYATAKSRGTGTLSAAIRDMDNYNFDKGTTNLYDIKTSDSMQQAADISFNSIMKQLNLSEADYVDMLKEQTYHIKQLEDELLRTRETSRLIYKQITKQDLLKELATELIKKGLHKEEVAEAILAEIQYDNEAIKKAKKGELK